MATSHWGREEGKEGELWEVGAGMGWLKREEKAGGRFGFFISRKRSAGSGGKSETNHVMFYSQHVVFCLEQYVSSLYELYVLCLIYVFLFLEQLYICSILLLEERRWFKTIKQGNIIASNCINCLFLFKKDLKSEPISSQDYSTVLLGDKMSSSVGCSFFWGLQRELLSSVLFQWSVVTLSYVFFVLTLSFLSSLCPFPSLHALFPHYILLLSFVFTLWCLFFILNLSSVSFFSYSVHNVLCSHYSLCPLFVLCPHLILAHVLCPQCPISTILVPYESFK